MAKSSFFSARCINRSPSTHTRCGLHSNHRGPCRAPGGEQWEVTPPSDSYSKLTKRHEPLYSWRWWTIGPRGMLKSITSEYLWTGPVGTTKLGPGGKPLRVSPRNPIEGCWIPDGYDWGVYSYKTPSQLFRYNPELQNKEPLVLGRVQNYGHVVEHEYGFRSQRVIVRDLTVFYRYIMGVERKTDYWTGALEHRYECPVKLVTRDKLNAWLTYYGNTTAKEEFDV
jgi:hypothetical protein